MSTSEMDDKNDQSFLSLINHIVKTESQIFLSLTNTTINFDTTE